MFRWVVVVAIVVVVMVFGVGMLGSVCVFVDDGVG